MSDVGSKLTHFHFNELLSTDNINCPTRVSIDIIEITVLDHVFLDDDPQAKAMEDVVNKIKEGVKLRSVSSVRSLYIAHLKIRL